MAPKYAQARYLVGVSLLAQGKRDEASREFEAALALAPDYIDPLAQLVNLAVAERRPEVAEELVKRQIARSPSGALHELLGRVYMARRRPDLAEAALLKAVELDPRLVGAYLRLGSLYGASGRPQEALAKLETALTVDPRNLMTLMLLGTLQRQRGDIRTGARDLREGVGRRALFAPAANNLAWLLTENSGDSDRALQLAQIAKEAAPDDPRISDTLRWILFNRGVHQQALVLLRDSAASCPTSRKFSTTSGWRTQDRRQQQRPQGVDGGRQLPARLPGEGRGAAPLGQLN